MCTPSSKRADVINSAGSTNRWNFDSAEACSQPRGRVLVVDDLVGNLKLVTALLEPDGHVVMTATTGDQAIDIVRRSHPDLVLLDVMMPDRDGFEVCRLLKSDAATRLTPIVLVTAMQDAGAKILGFDVGADDFIAKPFNPQELRARVRSLIRIKRYTDDLDTAESVIVSLALTIEARDPSTDGHCQRLAAYASALGEHLGLDEAELATLTRGGFLHDIGKVGIPDSILLKAGALTRDEYERMKSHTVIGDRLCGELRSLRSVRPIVRWHHERLDGSGYPDGLRGDNIPLVAQIMGIVDVFDAATMVRPYKPGIPPSNVCGELSEEAARGWRRTDLVDAFIELVRTNRLPRFDADADTQTVTAKRI